MDDLGGAASTASQVAFSCASQAWNRRAASLFNLLSRANSKPPCAAPPHYNL